MGPRPAGDLADIVLSNIPGKQRQAVDIALQDAVLALELLLSSGIEAAQSVYN
jgi:peptidyl-tRNA hydrolase